MKGGIMEGKVLREGNVRRVSGRDQKGQGNME